jgi:hypothetical protein
VATRTYGVPAATDSISTAVRGEGWLMFAVVMLSLAGMWNVLDGILAIGKSRVYGPESVYIFSDLRTWGFIVLALGALQLLAAFTILNGSEFGRWFGIGAAGVNAIGQLAFVPVNPVWGIAMFTVDVLIIYALTVYAGRRLRYGRDR